MDSLDNLTGPAYPASLINQAQRCLYNPKGLERWFTSFAQLGFKADGVTGNGGVDIICIGDSYTQGSGLTNDVQGFGIQDNGLLQAWPNQLRLILQRAINPPGISGGIGFVPMDRSGGAGHSVKNPIGSSGGSGNLDVNAPFNAWNGSTGSGGGLGRQLTQFLFTASQKYVLYDFNPALVPATHIQFFGVQGGAPYCDIYPTPANTSPITVGTGSYLADHSAMAGSFWGSVGPVLPINGGQVPPVNYRIQIYNKDASTDMYLSGFFLFNGDALAGVRVHNCGIGSATTAMWANETITQTSHAQMALSSADGNSITTTSNCRLIIIMLGANDWTGRTKAQFKVDVTTLVNWAGTLASAPSCMLVMQTPRFDGTADAWRSVMQFRDALKEICDDATLGAYTCLYDSWKYYNYLSPQAISSRFAAIQSDKVHPTASGHLAIARGIAANLIPRTAEATF